MYYTIYKITNKINGNFYIGKHKTKNLDDDYMGSGKLIKAAIKKHGIENFEKEILEILDTEEEMNAAEARLVVLGEGSYNLCPGGQGGWGYLNDSSEDHITRARVAANKTKNSLQEKYGVNNPSQLPHVKKIISSKTKERWLNNEFPIQLPGNWLGKKHTDESKRKIGLTNSLKQMGQKNSQFGTCWINKDGISYKIKKEMLEEYLTKGYSKGRKMKTMLP